MTNDLARALSRHEIDLHEAMVNMVHNIGGIAGNECINSDRRKPRGGYGMTEEERNAELKVMRAGLGRTCHDLHEIIGRLERLADEPLETDLRDGMQECRVRLQVAVDLASGSESSLQLLEEVMTGA